MPAASSEQLVYTTTDDNLTHAGLHIRPASGSVYAIAILWMHGLTGTFYGRITITIGRALASQGFTFVAGNNRGQRLRLRPRSHH